MKLPWGIQRRKGKRWLWMRIWDHGPQAIEAFRTRREARDLQRRFCKAQPHRKLRIRKIPKGGRGGMDFDAYHASKGNA